MHFLTKQELRQAEAVSNNKHRALTPIETVLVDVLKLAKTPNKSLDDVKGVVKRLEDVPGGFRLADKAQVAMISNDALQELLEPYPMVEFGEDIAREGDNLNVFQTLHRSGINFKVIDEFADRLIALYAVLEKLPQGHEVFIETPLTSFQQMESFYRESKDPKYRGITLPQALQREVQKVFSHNHLHSFANWGLLGNKDLWRRLRKDAPVSDFVLSREEVSPKTWLDGIDCLKAVNEKTDSVFYFQF